MSDADKTPLKAEDDNAPKIKYEIKKCNCFGYEIDLPLVALMLNNFFLNAACSVITPFFPPLATGEYKEAGDLSLSNFQVGLVIGMHPLAGFMFGMIMSKYLMNFGRKTVMLWSLIVTILTCFGMGISWYLKGSNDGFFALNLICRAFMGMARSGYGSATFAYAPMLWPHKVEKMIGLMESATGLGLMLGPIIGAGISFAFSFNEPLSYQMVFYVLCIVFAVFVYPSYIMLPQDQKIPPKQMTLSLFHVLGRRQIWTLFFLLTFVSASITFTYELWTNHLGTYGIGTEMSAIWLTSASMTYIISLQIIPKLMQHFIRGKGMISFRKVLESCGSMLSIFVVLFMAPETALGIPQEAWTVIFGMFTAGFAQGLAILPYIPEQNMLVVRLYPKNKKLELSESLTAQVTSQLEERKQTENKDYTQAEVEANVGEIIRKLYSDMAAGMFMSGYSLGTFTGPTIGGLIFDQFEDSEAAINSECNWGPNISSKINPCANQYSFKAVARIIYIIIIVTTILYMTIGEAWQGWRDLCKKKKQAQEMVQPQAIQNTKEEYGDKGNLTDALLTDTADQFTDAENQNTIEYDEETEEKLKMIKKRSDAEITANSGSARSSLIQA